MFVFAPATDDLRALLDRVAQLSASQRKAVTAIIDSTTEAKAKRCADAVRHRRRITAGGSELPVY